MAIPDDAAGTTTPSVTRSPGFFAATVGALVEHFNVPLTQGRFTDRMLDDLSAMLQPLRRDTSPTADEIPRLHARHALWVEPRVVGEVVFTEWTKDDRMRHPAWRGLRPDKSAAEVVREP
mgnify:CR=1 FL=1